jgi:hypothetical protein
MDAWGDENNTTTICHPDPDPELAKRKGKHLRLLFDDGGNEFSATAH